MGHTPKDCFAMKNQEEKQLNLHAHSKSYKSRSAECTTVEMYFISIFLYREYEINLKRDTNVIWMHMISLDKIMT